MVVDPQMTFSDLIHFKASNLWVLVTAAMIAGVLGMIAHYYKKNYKSETACSIYQWFITHNLRGTLYSIGSTLAAVWTTIAPMQIDAVSMYQIIVLGFGIGFASDSAFNSDAKATPEQDSK